MFVYRFLQGLRCRARWVCCAAETKLYTTMTFQMIKFSMIHLAPYQTKFTVTGFTFIENEIPLLRYCTCTAVLR